MTILHFSATVIFFDRGIPVRYWLLDFPGPFISSSSSVPLRFKVFGFDLPLSAQTGVANMRPAFVRVLSPSFAPAFLRASVSPWQLLLHPQKFPLTKNLEIR